MSAPSNALASSVQLKKPEEPEVLQEDDEFEEFEDDWDAREEDQDDEKLWEDDWDDDAVEDEFTRQLRAELDKSNSRPMDVS